MTTKGSPVIVVLLLALSIVLLVSQVNNLRESIIEGGRKSQIVSAIVSGIIYLVETLASVVVSFPRLVVGLISTLVIVIVNLISGVVLFLTSSITLTTTTTTTTTAVPATTTTLITSSPLPTTSVMTASTAGPITTAITTAALSTTSTGITSAVSTVATNALTTTSTGASTAVTSASLPMASTTTSTSASTSASTASSSSSLPTTSTTATSTSASTSTSTTASTSTSTTSTSSTTTTESTTTTTPQPSKIVFVTNDTFSGNLGGVDGADAKCASAAAGASLEGSFLAWISNSSVSPSNRFARSDDAYKLVNGSVIAANYASLTSSDLLFPINIDQNGATVPESDVWTFTLNNGLPVTLLGPVNCGEWMIDGSGTGVKGTVGDTNPGFSFSGTRGCDELAPLYCFQQ